MVTAVLNEKNKTTRSRAKTLKKEIKPVTVETPPQPKQEAEQETTVTVPAVSCPSEGFKVMADKILSLSKELKALSNDLKTLQSQVKKSLKASVKRKHTKRSANSPLHGFIKPVKISDDLAEFLNEEKGFMISRPQVTKRISQYIRSNSLSDPTNGSFFLPDDKLKKILGEPKYLLKSKQPELGHGYSYQNLQSYLSTHFIKN